MERAGTFSIEDTDIVRLDPPDGPDESRARSGWVNVGAHSIFIEVNQDGDLTVECYPLGNEHAPTEVVQVSHKTAMDKGAQDLDA